MNRESLRLAIAEAHRFVDRANKLEELLQSQIHDKYHSLKPKECGSVRRASMDLTRALAEMRKAG